MASDKPTINCKTEKCPNLCYPPNIYCGRCAGYEHEMTAAEKRECIRGTRSYADTGQRNEP